MSSLADETPNVEALNLSSSPNSADSTDSDDESDDEVKSVSGPAAEKKIVKALGLKEEGNAFFKEKVSSCCVIVLRYRVRSNLYCDERRAKRAVLELCSD